MWPYLFSKGLVLYKDIFFIYPPFYYLLLSGWDKFAGISLGSLQAFSYLIIAVTDLALYWCAGRRLWPVVIYIPLQVFFEGNGMWPDQLLAPIFLLGYQAVKTQRYLLLGVAVGLALMTKQTAAYTALVLIAAMAVGRTGTGSWWRFLAGSAAVFGIILLYLLQSQSGPFFIAQAWTYIITYHAGNTLQQLWPTGGQMVVLLLVFAPPIFFGLHRRRYFLVIMTLAATLGMFTRFSYFHLQPALPFLAMLVSINLLNIPFYLVLLYLCVKMMIGAFASEPRFLTREIINNARIINRFVPAGEKTLIFTSWDHLYWLTGTVPVGHFFGSSIPWNFNYPGVQERIVKDLSTEKPRYVVLGKCFVAKGTCYRPEKVTEYVSSHYRQVSELSDGTGVFEDDPVGLR